LFEPLVKIIDVTAVIPQIMIPIIPPKIIPTPAV
tara:strand:- start:68 stop:169 length:102 start_codon:yes stop_codon:yes gene_type:complete